MAYDQVFDAYNTVFPQRHITLQTFKNMFYLATDDKTPKGRYLQTHPNCVFLRDILNDHPELSERPYFDPENITMFELTQIDDLVDDIDGTEEDEVYEEDEEINIVLMPELIEKVRLLKKFESDNQGYTDPDQ